MEKGRSFPSCPLRCEVRNSDVEIRQLTNPVRPNSVIPPQSVTFSGDNNFSTTAVSNPIPPASPQYPSFPEANNFTSTTMVTPLRPNSVIPPQSMNISEENNFSSTAMPNPIVPASALSSQYPSISKGNNFNSIRREISDSPQAIRNRNRRRYFKIF